MTGEIQDILNSSTYLFSTTHVENEPLVHAVVRSEGDRIVADHGSNQAVFFNLEESEEFDSKAIVFKPKNHRIAKDGGSDYITVEKKLVEFDESILDESIINKGEEQDTESEEQDTESEEQDTESEEQDTVDPFSTTEADQNVGKSDTISVTSTDSDMLSDIDVHRF